MPWSFPDNIPNSMKNLPDEKKKKAISIANAILREGGEEGIAIATGIKKSKELEKVAQLKEKLLTLGIPTVAGAIGGGIVGSTDNKTNIGATVGGLGSLGLALINRKQAIKKLISIKKFDREVEERLSQLEKNAIDKNKKIALGMGVSAVGTSIPNYMFETTGINNAEYVHTPEGVDILSPEIKNKLMRKAKLTALLVPIVTGSAVYGALKAKEKLSRRKKSSTQF